MFAYKHYLPSLFVHLVFLQHSINIKKIFCLRLGPALHSNCVQYYTSKFEQWGSDTLICQNDFLQKKHVTDKVSDMNKQIYDLLLLLQATKHDLALIWPKFNAF